MNLQSSRLWLTAVLGIGLVGVASAQTVKTFDSKTVLVKFKTNSATVSRIAHSAIGARVKRELPRIGVQSVTIPSGWTVDRALAYYRRLPSVKFAEPNYIRKATATVNDPLYNQQYWLDKVGAPAAWDLTLGDTGVRIAIADTGVDYTHEDLKGKVEMGHDYIQDDNDPMDVQGHGTHCAGIAAAHTNNGIGGAGLGYGSTIVAIRVLGDDGGGTSETVAGGILNAADLKVDVLSLSLGGFGFTDTEKAAIETAQAAGVTILAAAGNNGVSEKFYPAAFPECIAVGATDSNDQQSNFTNFGSDWVDVAAPGVGIMSTVMGNKYEAWDGTSMATPVVAGLAGLMKAYSPSATNLEIREAIESTTVNVGNWVFYGRINAPAAINAIQPPEAFEGDPTDVIAVPGNGTNLVGTVNDVSNTDSVGATVNASRVMGVGWLAALNTPVTSFDPAKFVRGTISVRHKSVAQATTSVFLYNFTASRWDLVKSAPGSSSFVTTQITLNKNTVSNYISNGAFNVVVRSNVPVRFSRALSGYSLSVDRVVINADIRSR